MATIKDVARAADVSVTTVSHVINGTRTVAPETAARVHDAVTRLAYAPSGVARALKANRTLTIGMMVTNSTNPFFAEVIQGVESACSDRGYSLMLCNSADDPLRQHDCLATLRMKRIDALVVMTRNMNPKAPAAFATAGVPTLALDAEATPGIATVADDSHAGGLMAGRFLTERGFRRIACVTGPAGHPRAACRMAGFTAALTTAALTIDPALVMPGDLTVASGRRAMGALLAQPRSAWPDAVFCFNDMSAMGALCAANEVGLSVPGDVSVMGYDDIELAAYMTPPLTTIRQDTRGLGTVAATTLIDHLDGVADLPPVIKTTPRLVERRSVGRPAACRQIRRHPQL
ncbi:LacI family DNA-binding transcriptional regulator [Roseospira visakhapatnamensis]|uniref:DNA-binding LacI/PurR family transcriptional regulator n=1 Tax=Roseospira visakhapatnamensis TaxID=390880 RepID=A0A7W6RDY6_9PROT|nr:LacI family DNA-binding transcriptional regulator [Roseospira visakhapatnamensis]MBB4266143.1 DNA-binding LacI/PurR family transcriptional regulator [Roseospira visakhapatnamensis]